MGLFSKKSTNEKVLINTVVSPVDGEAKELSHVNDGVFSEGMLGKGIVIDIPSGAKTVTFMAPMTGELVAAFPTGHAYGIKNKFGVEILLHIGIDTVNLNGKGFKSHVRQGQTVRVGQPLVDVDVESVRKHAPSADAIIVVTSGQDIHDKASGEVATGSELFVIK